MFGGMYKRTKSQGYDLSTIQGQQHRITASTLKNAWHNLWSVLMSEDSPGSYKESEFGGFHVKPDKQLLHELMDYIRDLYIEHWRD